MSHKPSARLSPELRLLLWFAAIAALVRLATLGMYPLMDQTEARYAEIARRMAELGDWVTPWLDDGVPFWGKPPLSFWMTAASFKVFGVGEFAARLPHWLCAIAIAALVGSWRARSQRESIYSVVFLSAAALFFALAGSVMTDTALALGTTMAMRGFWLGLNETGSRRLGEQGLFFLGIAIGLLAKGPLTLVLVGVPIFVWTLASGNFRRVLREIHWLAGLLILLVLVVPWYMLAESRTPGFLEYFLVGEHWYRFTVPGWTGDLYGHAHVFPRGTIWLCAILALVPWTLLVPIAAWRWPRLTESPGRADRPLITYLACWALAPCVFFTLCGNILPTYVLPGLPAAIMLMAMMVARLPRERVERRLLPAGIATTVIVTLALLIAFRAGGWDEKTSTKALLRDFESRRTGSEVLVFFPKRPLSGSFYSGGRAEQAMTVEQLEARLVKGPIFVAVDERHARRVPADFPTTLRSVSRHGDYELFQTVPK